MGREKLLERFQDGEGEAAVKVSGWGGRSCLKGFRMGGGIKKNFREFQDRGKQVAR